MIKQQIITYVKMAVGLMLAFVFSVALTQHMFIDFSPQIRPRLVEYLQLRANDMVTAIRERFTDYDETEYADKLNPTIEELQNRTVQKAPGIRSSQYSNASYTEIDTEKIELKEIEVTLKNGNTVTVKVPKYLNDLPAQE